MTNRPPRVRTEILQALRDCGHWCEIAPLAKAVGTSRNFALRSLHILKDQGLVEADTSKRRHLFRAVSPRATPGEIADRLGIAPSKMLALSNLAHQAEINRLREALTHTEYVARRETADALSALARLRGAVARATALLTEAVAELGIEASPPYRFDFAPAEEGTDHG